VKELEAAGHPFYVVSWPVPSQEIARITHAGTGAVQVGYTGGSSTLKNESFLVTSVVFVACYPD
jgi:hypothetical protein